MDLNEIRLDLEEIRPDLDEILPDLDEILPDLDKSSKTRPVNHSNRRRTTISGVFSDQVV